MKKLISVFAAFIIAISGVTVFADSETGKNESSEIITESDMSLFQHNTLEAGYDHFAAVLEDGHVITINDVGADNDFDVSNWENIVSVAAGGFFTVGLKKNGTVIGTGTSDSYTGVEGWTDIIAVACGLGHTVGLKKDGTVVAVGLNDHGQTNVSNWSDIVAIGTGSWSTFGIKRDGTVIAAGYNEYGQCNVSDWKDIVAITGNDWSTFGLKSDGTVVYTGYYDSSSKSKLDVLKRLTDIVAIKAYGDTDVFAISANGTILSLNNRLATGNSGVDAAFSRWNNTTLRMLSDGTLMCTNRKLEGDIENALQGRKLQLPTAYSKDSTDSSDSQDVGIWTVKAYVDEFDLPTDDYYIVNEDAFDGTFSNSATTNSTLKAYLFYQAIGVSQGDIVSIRLLEYGNYKVTNPYSTSCDYNIVIMDSGGNKTQLKGRMLPNSYDVYITDTQPILDALREGGTVRFAITEKEDPLTKYIITIDDATGFDVAYRQFWSK